MKRFAFDILQQREEADWTLLLAKDKISVPGAWKQFSNKNETQIFIFMMIPGICFAQICRQRCMVSLELIPFGPFCNLDILSIAFVKNRKIALKSKIATHVETDEIILLMELN